MYGAYKNNAVLYCGETKNIEKKYKDDILKL